MLVFLLTEHRKSTELS